MALSYSFNAQKVMLYGTIFNATKTLSCYMPRRQFLTKQSVAETHCKFFLSLLSTHCRNKMLNSARCVALNVVRVTVALLAKAEYTTVDCLVSRELPESNDRAR